MILVRVIKEIKPDKWAEYLALQKRTNARHVALGLPARKCYVAGLSGMTNQTTIEDSEYESLSAFEASGEKRGDPELREIRRQYMPLLVSRRTEILRLL